MEVEAAPLADDRLGPLLARGRDAAVFALGADRVVRRTTGGGDLEQEAVLMEHVRAAGYPVPRVWRVAPGEMVLDRVAGPTMADDLGRRPWLAARRGRQLAGLHTALHRIPAPDGLRPHAVEGDAILHLDLHPMNVMLTAAGPVVIDWTNARRGAAAADVADVWIVLASLAREPEPAATWPGRVQAAVVDRLEPAVRRRLLDAFLEAAGRAEAAAVLPAAAAHRLADRNIRPAERARVEAVVARHAP